MITSDEARRLQSEVVRVAWRYVETGSRMTRPALQRAAQEVALANGFTNGVHLQSTIGKEFQKMKGTGGSNGRAPALQPMASKATKQRERAEALAERFVERLDFTAGRLPRDWELVIELGVELVDCRHARRVLKERGWDVRSTGAGFAFTPPAVKVTEPEPVNGVQTTLELTESGDMGEVLRELRQIRGLLAKLLQVWG